MVRAVTPGRTMIEPIGKTSARRRFLSWLTRFFLSLWGIGFAGVVSSYLRNPSRVQAFDVIHAGNADTLAAGTARLVRHGNNPLYVVRLTNGELVSLSGLCTHYRCVLTWNSEDRLLVCPCHKGTFSATGQVIAGLPTRDLPRYAVEVRLGEIIVHPQRRI